MPIQFTDIIFLKKLLYCHKVIRIPNFNLWIIWIILYNLPEVQANSCSVHSPSFRVLLICDLQWFGSSSDLSGQSTLWSHRHNFEMQWIPKCSRNFDLLYLCLFQVILGLDFFSLIFIKNFPNILEVKIEINRDNLTPCQAHWVL